MGARMVAQRNVAHYLNDPYYRTLFNEARAQLREALVKECGTTIVECAASTGKRRSVPRSGHAYLLPLHHDL